MSQDMKKTLEDIDVRIAENNIEVAFQGEDGSFGQEVAFNFFGRSVKTRQC